LLSAVLNEQPGDVKAAFWPPRLSMSDTTIFIYVHFGPVLALLLCDVNAPESTANQTSSARRPHRI